MYHSSTWHLPSPLFFGANMVFLGHSIAPSHRKTVTHTRPHGLPARSLGRTTLVSLFPMVPPCDCHGSFHQPGLSPLAASFALTSPFFRSYAWSSRSLLGRTVLVSLFPPASPFGPHDPNSQPMLFPPGSLLHPYFLVSMRYILGT